LDQSPIGDAATSCYRAGEYPVKMNRNERRRHSKKARKKDTRTGDAARRKTTTRSSSHGAEESKPDLYRDEGGES
jgi:hypothetical protein